MGLSPERLAEIDGELDSFDKSDEELADVVRRAVEVAGSFEDIDGTLDALGEGLEEAIAAALAEVVRSEAVTSPGRVEAEGKKSKKKSKKKKKKSKKKSKAPSEAPVAAEPEAAEAAPEELAPEPTDEARASLLSDIAGLSVDELFEDAEPSNANLEIDGLGDLFDETLSVPPEAAERDDLSLEQSLEPPGSLSSPPYPAPEPAGSVPPPPPPRRSSLPPIKASAPPPPPGLSAPLRPSLPKFDEEVVESTSEISAEELDAMSVDDVFDEDDFELLVDEDVLVMDEEGMDEKAESAPLEGFTDEMPEEEGDDEGGLISRILGRK